MAERIECKILDMNAFLTAVDRCRGPVTLLDEDGCAVRLDRQSEIRTALLERHRKSRGCLPLTLELPSREDYISLIRVCAGDCFQFFSTAFFLKLTDQGGAHER